tara:strand:- start:28 stop:216 length:189 start_codon:yes stop_codon:yes gene_type:complete
MLKKKIKYIYMNVKMLTDEDCEEIGTAVGMLTIKLFKFLFEMIKEFKRLTGLFNSNEDTKQS